MPTPNAFTIEQTATEIAISRTLNAPREKVFQVWTQPQHVANWFGPNGFSLTTHSMDVRTGGSWVFTMHGPDGTDYYNRVFYQEVVEPERLVYNQDDGDANDSNAFHVTLTFEAQGNATLLTLRTAFKTEAAKQFAIDTIGAIEGGTQTLGRLAEYLSEQQA